MLETFAIEINTAEEMRIARGVLKALGYPIYSGLEAATDMDSFTVLQLDTIENSICRGAGWGIQPWFTSLNDFLISHFGKSYREAEIGRLEDQITMIQKRLQELRGINHAA